MSWSLKCHYELMKTCQKMPELIDAFPFISRHEGPKGSVIMLVLQIIHFSQILRQHCMYPLQKMHCDEPTKRITLQMRREKCRL